MQKAEKGLDWFNEWLGFGKSNCAGGGMGNSGTDGTDPNSDYAKKAGDPFKPAFWLEWVISYQTFRFNSAEMPANSASASQCLG